MRHRIFAALLLLPLAGCHGGDKGPLPPITGGPGYEPFGDAGAQSTDGGGPPVGFDAGNPGPIDAGLPPSPDAGSMPVPVASVTLTADQPVIPVGSNEELTAIARDAQGQVIPGATFTWISSDSTIATVTPAGLVSGLKAGSVDVTASSGGVTSAPVTMTFELLPSIVMLMPNAGFPGTRVQITGQGFGTTPGTVTFDTVSATVLDWNDTTIDAVVPQLQPGKVFITVKAGSFNTLGALYVVAGG